MPRACTGCNQFRTSAIALAICATGCNPDRVTARLEDDINRFAEAGITTGCAPGQFCPSNPVTRGQMAAFLHRAFEP